MDRRQPDDPDAGIVDDKVADARERVGRIEKEGRGPSVETTKDAQDTEDRISEREELDQAARP
jgi:hypothetical protein